MPLLDGTQVSPLPLPSKLTTLSADTEVWSIHQTGEIFLDYESYANRYIFYSQPIFKPNHHVQEPQEQASTDLLTFFDALQSENQELDRLIQTEFSDSLKSRILACITTPDAQREHSIDNLTNHLYKLHYNRFHKDEKVIVDLSFNQPPSPSSTIYTAKIVKVFPPKPLRDLVKSKGVQLDLIHLQSIDQFKLNLTETLKIDDSKSYLYTIQLIEDSQSVHHDQEDGFGGSFMEVEPKKLSRHPNSFSKSLLKKFIQSSLLPVSTTQPNPRWRVPDELMQKYGLINTQPPIPIPNLSAHVPRSRPKRGPPLTPTSRLIDHPEITDPETKRTIKKRKRNKISSTPLMVHHPPTYETYLHPQCSINPKPQEDPPVLHAINLMEWKPSDSFSKIISKPSPPLETPDHKKKKKWRMSSSKHHMKEDLRVIPKSMEKEVPRKLHLEQQASNSNSEPSLSTPVVTENGEPLQRANSVKKTIKYPIEDLDLDPLTMIDGRYLRRSSGLIPSLPIKPIPSQPKDPKTFEKSLMIWSFLNIFELIDCKIEELEDQLDLIIERLVKEIQVDLSLRYPTCKNEGNGSRFKSRSVLPFFSNQPIQETKVMKIEAREYWIRKSIKFSNLWRLTIDQTLVKEQQIQESKKKKKSKESSSSHELKEDWVMGLVEIMCQRGGIEQIGCMGRLMQYLFSKDGTLTLLPTESDINPIIQPQEYHSTNSINLPTSNHHNKIEVENGIRIEEEEEEAEEEEIDEMGIEEIQRYGESLMNRRKDYQFMKQILKSRFSEWDSDEKLSLIRFLCDLVIEGHYIRNYIEDCDEKLTIVRKEKADVNKEKRKILEELSKLGNGSKPLNETSLKFTGGDELDPITHQSSTVTTPILPSPTQPINPTNETEDPQSSTTCTITDITNLETPVRMNTLLNSKSIKAPKHSMKSQGNSELKDPKEKYEVELFRLNLKEIYLNERFRKFNGVMKTKPIGMDRYFCKYWWFDGIGGNSNCVGQLFVSGPSIDEMDWVLNKLQHHRFHHHHYCQSDENGNEKQIGIGLGVGEWAVYDTEVQIQGLLNWLNPKGNRESVLRMNLKDWKEYIFEKIKSRCNESNDQKHEGNAKNGEDHEDRMEIQTDSSLSSQEDEPEEPEEEEIEYNQSSSDDDDDDQSSESESDSSSESDD